MLEQYTLVLVPGLRGHVEDHWQTILSREVPGSVVAMPDQPLDRSRAGKVLALERCLSQVQGRVVLVAHSAGCHTVAHWASQALPSLKRVEAALLVTPADIERDLPAGYPTQSDLTSDGWLPAARRRLPFTTMVCASDNDPLAQTGRVLQMAADWGARMTHLGKVGHMNPASGFGRWDGALGVIESLLKITVQNIDSPAEARTA